MSTQALRVAFDGNYSIMKVLGGRETFDVKLTNDSMFDLALTKSKDTNKVDISLHL